MQKLFFTFFFSLILCSICAQTTDDYSVQLSATVQNSPPSINLKWVADPGATSYSIYKKLKTATTWGAVYATLPGNAIQHTDTNVTAGISYEYKLQKAASGYTGYGYINSGIEVPETECRGRLILIIDSTYKNNLSAELKRLEEDLTGDGWVVIRHDVSRNDAVTKIKNLITADYNADPQNTKAVFLFGRIPVPYSGNIMPDGHTFHQGAWPADVYYGEMQSTWTDATVNTTSASDPRNDNIPGDGKFDQSSIPSDVELQVGRVDFAKLTSFTKTEVTLLKKYLDKNHQYRYKMFSPVNRALIDDNFGAMSGEAFAANGWKNFSPLVGTANVTNTVDYVTGLKSGSYVWSYGCGPGTPTTCSGVCSLSNFVSDSLRSVFTILFGSAFGDWDYTNALMRASLASGSTLSVFWAGRPHWQFHHMGMGENIGYSTLLSQNNNSLYAYNNAQRYVHIALIGDPSLRMYMIAPPANLSATAAGTSVQLIWTASADAVLGYNVYRFDILSGCYIKINPSLITGLNYVDSSPVNGTNYYMVRALKLETTPSGSFYNMSQGIFGTISLPVGVDELANSQDVIVYPNPTNGVFNVQMSGLEKVQIKIYNMLGECIHQQIFKSVSQQIDLSSKPAGVYFLQVKSENATAVQKLILQK